MHLIKWESVLLLSHLSGFSSPAQYRPNHQLVACRMESSAGIRARRAHVFFFLHVLVPVCMLQSVIIGKISASEPSRKFTESALLVGMEVLFRQVLF